MTMSHQRDHVRRSAAAVVRARKQMPKGTRDFEGGIVGGGEGAGRAGREKGGQGGGREGAKTVDREQASVQSDERWLLK